MRAARLVLLLVMPACDGVPTPTPQAYTDQAGRSCTRAVDGAVTCTEQPSPSIQCDDAGGAACWFLSTVLSDDGGANLTINCEGCCNSTTHQSTPADCSPVACQADTDCPLDFNVCTSGACTF